METKTQFDKKKGNQDNEERERQKRKEYYEKNKERLSKKRKERYERQKIKIKKQVHDYYEENRFRKLNKQKQWRERNKERIAEYLRQNYYKTKELRSIRAKTRNLFRKFDCKVCSSKKDLQFHHLKPLRFDNFEVLCKSCHYRKHNKELVLNV